MTGQENIYLAILGGFFILLLLWTASLAFVNWDAQRRLMSRSERRIWLALTALLPPFGLFAYLFSRFGGFSDQRSSPLLTEESERRMTGLKPPRPSQEVRQPTIPGTAYVNQTMAEAPVRPVQPGIPAPKAPFVLEVIRGPHAGATFPLENLPLRVGRGPEQPIRLDGDLAVSRAHAELYTREDGLRIRDLNSTHGTLVNGMAVADQHLRSGDQVQIGQSVMVVKQKRTGKGT